jgi:CRP/FNR family transcriptional regulator, cyclic AMP receptor protein
VPHPSSRDGSPTTERVQSRLEPTDAVDPNPEFSIRLPDHAAGSGGGPATALVPSEVGQGKRALLRDDAELASTVPAADRARATRALRVQVRDLAPGAVDLAGLDLPESTFAVLITRGAITYEVVLDDRVMAEMFLEGDVLLLDSPSPTAPESSCRLVVVQDARLAVLDRRFALAAARWPGLMRAVMSRLADQQHRLAVHGAICQLPRVEQRIIAILCHLASRTGIVTPEGLLLRHPLSHQALGDLIGARRPTVSLAVTSLQHQDLIRRRRDGSWLVPHYNGQQINVENLIPTTSTAQATDDGLAKCR